MIIEEVILRLDQAWIIILWQVFPGLIKIKQVHIRWVSLVLPYNMDKIPTK